VNKLRWSTARVGLEQHYSSDVVTIVLGREDGFITGPVLDEHEKQVVRSGHGLGLGRGIQLEDDLECAVDVLQSWISVQYKNGVRGGLPYLDDLMSIIRVHVCAIHSAVEHLEIPPVCVERP
jgi:hypothetical protein